MRLERGGAVRLERGGAVRLASPQTAGVGGGAYSRHPQSRTVVSVGRGRGGLPRRASVRPCREQVSAVTEADPIPALTAVDRERLGGVGWYDEAPAETPTRRTCRFPSSTKSQRAEVSAPELVGVPEWAAI